MPWDCECGETGIHGNMLKCPNSACGKPKPRAARLDAAASPPPELSRQARKEKAAAELMAMPPDEQLLHIKGVGFARARTLSQQNIAPYCHLIADNPLEGGRLPPNPKITLTMPEEAR